MRYLVRLASLAVAITACQDTIGTGMDDAAPPEAASHANLDLRLERATLIAAGNEVSSDIAARGVAVGLGNAFTHNGLLLSPRVATIEGREAAMNFLSTAPNAPSALSWEVIIADVSSDASHGYTWSQGSTTLDLGTGAITIPSFFLTYWKRTDSGRWRIAAFVLNQGGPQPLPLPDGFGTPTTRRGRQFPPTDLKTLRKELRATDAAFSAASVATRRDRGSVRQRSRRRGELGAALRRRREERRSGLHGRRRLVRSRGHPSLLHQVPHRMAEAEERAVAVRG
jgi:hypothetical protein